jgi:hypothetical protein
VVPARMGMHVPTAAVT